MYFGRGFEKQLVKTLPAEKGRDLVKQVRTQLIETARPVLEEMVQEVTGVKVLSLHHDISTVTGEKVVLFTLASDAFLSRNDEEIGLSESNVLMNSRAPWEEEEMGLVRHWLIVLLPLRKSIRLGINRQAFISKRKICGGGWLRSCKAPDPPSNGAQV